MTTFGIILACLGFILCAVVFAFVCIVVSGIILWAFKTEVDITIDENDYE